MLAVDAGPLNSTHSTLANGFELIGNFVLRLDGFAFEPGMQVCNWQSQWFFITGGSATTSEPNGNTDISDDRWLLEVPAGHGSGNASSPRSVCRHRGRTHVHAPQMTRHEIALQYFLWEDKPIGTNGGTYVGNSNQWNGSVGRSERDRGNNCQQAKTWLWMVRYLQALEHGGNVNAHNHANATQNKVGMAETGLPACGHLKLHLPVGDSARGWQLRCPDGGTRVVLGRGDLDERFERLWQLLEDEDIARSLAKGEHTIDLRFAGQAVLRSAARVSSGGAPEAHPRSSS